MIERADRDCPHHLERNPWPLPGPWPGQRVACSAPLRGARHGGGPCAL